MNDKDDAYFYLATLVVMIITVSPLCFIGYLILRVLNHFGI